ALLLAFPDAMRQRLLPWLLSYATGTLLGAAFLGMIPQGLKHAAPLAITGTVLAGLVGFFILEKLVIWRHCHDADCEEHGHQAGTLILLGDAFHNFVDGVVIAAAFLTSVPLGIATALAVIAHEIPQELGDFAILLHSGLSKSRAFVYNLLSSLTTLPGVIIGWFWLAETRAAIPFVLAISAASFIYIAVADLVPSLHRHTALKSSLIQVGLILAGIATIAFFRIGH
ncbi:ZIP family metal transporter, partial [Polaromonas sp.]|uniref:ZIP family metal transporter n=1 Tax=Polaromonas sp. TaxID=1869339 RepID=UPI002BCEB24E